MYIQRQIAMTVGEGQKTTLPDMRDIYYRMTDVQPKYALNIANGEYSSDKIRLDASDSYTVQLPENYTNASRLHCCFVVKQADCKAVIVSPDHGTSTVLLKATTGTTNGEHAGVLMFSGTVTSIVLSVDAGADSSLIEYFLYKIPDLSLAASWRIGSRAVGSV